MKFRLPNAGIKKKMIDPGRGAFQDVPHFYEQPGARQGPSPTYTPAPTQPMDNPDDFMNSFRQILAGLGIRF